MRVLLLAASLVLLAVGQAQAAPSPFATFKSKREARAAFAQFESGLAQHKGSSQLRELYREFLKRQGLEFSGAEDARRFAIFQRNVRRIIAINRSPDTSHWAGLTKWAVATRAELRPPGLNAMGPPPVRNPTAATRAAGRKAGAAPPPRVDWRAAGGVTPVREQGTCGCCWAFAALAAVESRLRLQLNQSHDLSEQQVVDCQAEAKACSGGWLTHPLTYAASTGLVTEAAYPYHVGSCAYTTRTNTTFCFNNTCPTTLCRTCAADRVAATAPKVKLAGDGFIPVAAGSKEAIMQAVATLGPVAVAYNVVSDFRLYKGGVYTKAPGTCGTNTSINHGVLIVGYDTVPANGDPPHFICKNSWGTDFGESGYFKMGMTDDALGVCQLYVYGGYVATNATIIPPPSPSPSPKPVPIITESTAPLIMVLGQYTNTVQGQLRVLRADATRKFYWGTICAAGGFDHVAASVACKQMGRGEVGFGAAMSVYGPGTNSWLMLWLSGVRCSGSESRLQDCQHSQWGQPDPACTHSDDVGAYCGLYPIQLVTVAGAPARTYRVEARLANKWGTVCSDGFTEKEATVLCKQFKFGASGRVVQLSATSKPPAGAASQPIWLGGVACNGNEATLQACKHGLLLGQHSCPLDHSRDLGIQCILA